MSTTTRDDNNNSERGQESWWHVMTLIQMEASLKAKEMTDEMPWFGHDASAFVAPSSNAGKCWPSKMGSLIQ
eukprot:13930305-Ditylum_brightwellii.AAC.1